MAIARLAAFCFIGLSLLGTTSAFAIGVSTWLCGITGWFFCNLDQAAIIRTDPPALANVALARYDLRLGREEVLVARCRGCRAIAALDGGDLVVLGADGLYRWSSRVGAIESILKHNDLFDLLGRYPKDPDGFLVMAKPTREGLCPPVLRFDLRTGAVQDLEDPAANKAARDCPWLLAGTRPGQFDPGSEQLLMTRGGNRSTPAVILVENLRDRTVHRLVDDPGSALNNGRRRYSAVWISSGTAIAYLLEGVP
jgi:hypothetical protein